MFGYVAPLSAELKVSELAIYRAYYCGLCDALARDYGAPGRAALSYDMAFFALLIDGVSGGGEASLSRCPYKPLQKKRPKAARTPALGFTADLAVTLVRYKLEDDARDGKRILPAAGKAALSGAFKKAKLRAAKLDDIVSSGMDELVSLERAGSRELDAPCDAFARTLRLAAMEAPVEHPGDRIAIGGVAYNLGKWIYLADAWDDREDDAKKGCYNVFNIADAGEERARFLMEYSLSEAQRAFELVSFKANGGIIENTLYLGCPAKTAELFGGKK